MCCEAVLSVSPLEPCACFLSSWHKFRGAKCFPLVLIYAEITALPEQGKGVIAFLWNGLSPSTVKLHKIVINMLVSYYLALSWFSFSLAS